MRSRSLAKVFEFLGELKKVYGRERKLYITKCN